MFNDSAWKQYLRGRGKKTVKMFEKHLGNALSEDYAYFIEELHKKYCPCANKSENIRNQLLSALDNVNKGEHILEFKRKAVNSALKSFYNASKSIHKNPQCFFNDFILNMEYYTTLFSIEKPELFVPYYFAENFNILNSIAVQFEIELPPMPPKEKYDDRYTFYGNICIALTKFRKMHNMSIFELYAFLYDYAPKTVGGKKSYMTNVLPEPKSAYFMNEKSGDSLLCKSRRSVICRYCNENSAVGDIGVMYARLSDCTFKAVWRIASPSFIDPFTEYYRCAYFIKPTPTYNLTNWQLQFNIHFKNVSFVQNEFKAIDGKEIEPYLYNILANMLQADIPRLKSDATYFDDIIINEPAIANNYMLIFIKLAGLVEKKYEPKLVLKSNNMGTFETYYLSDFNMNKNTALIIINAKLKLSQKSLEKERRLSIDMAKSFKSKFVFIGDKHNVWVYSAKDDFESVIFATLWSEMKETDAVNRLRKALDIK